MSVILSSKPLHLTAGRVAHTDPFSHPSTTVGPIVIVLVVSAMKAPAQLDIRLETQSGAGFSNAGLVTMSTAGPAGNSVRYGRISQAQGTMRLAITSPETGHIDMFAIDPLSAGDPWSANAHRLDALGTAVAAEIPSLQLGLERILHGLLTTTTAQSGGPVKPAPGAREGIHLPPGLLPYVLGNRIDHLSVPAAEVHRIAASIHMSEVQLREHVDHLNALAEVMLTIARSRVSQGAAGLQSQAINLCGFWSYHIDPGPCADGDVFICNTVDVHYS
jgi:hypothetical protein